MNQEKARGNVEIRPLSSDDQILAFLEVARSTFATDVDAESVDSWRKESDRTRALAAWDGGLVVGSAAANRFDLTVPGGALPMAGIGSVAVIPTYTRMGILTRFMRRLLDDAQERGEPVAGLWASEGTIYRRFGFGWATSSKRVAISTEGIALVRTTGRDRGRDRRVRFVDDDKALKILPEIYNQVRLNTPGMLTRSMARWERWVDHDPGDWHEPWWRADVGPRLHVVWGETGYLSYRVQRRWDRDSPAFRPLVVELMATEPEAYRGLWGWLLELDLVRSIIASRRPVNEPLERIVQDPRMVRAEVMDGLWLRIVNPQEALAHRSYAADGALRLRVVDAFGPWADGTYIISHKNGQTECTRTMRDADVTIGVEALGAAYLGGVRILDLAEAGLVDSSDIRALQRLDAMLMTYPSPWCCVGF